MSKRMESKPQKDHDGVFRRMTLSLTLVGLAIAAHVAFKSFLPKHLPFFPFAVAILVSCRCGGSLGGMVATAASAIALRCWFLEPAAAFWDEGRLGFLLFLAAGVCVSWQANAAEKKPVKAEAAETNRVDAEPEMTPFEYA